MAKRRSSRGRSRRRRERADWVYRPSIVEADGGIIGSYDPAGLAHTLLANVAVGAVINGQIMVLYDSVDYQEVLLGTSFAGQNGLPRAARAEGRNPVILCTEGHIIWHPTTWDADNRLMLGWRLGWFEQDTLTGLITVQQEYSFWDDFSGLNTGAAIFANEKLANVKEGVIVRSAAGDDSTPQDFVQRIFWKGRRRAPSSKHCWCLYVECPADIIGLAGVGSFRFLPRLRSLVVDEG